MAKHFVVGSKEWLEAFREGGFVGKHPVPPSPPTRYKVRARLRGGERWSIRQHHGKPCPYCHQPMLVGSRRKPTRDHIVPKSQGGDLTPGNRIIVCSPCNNEKADRTIEVWLYWLRKDGDPRADIVAALIESMRC